MSAADFLLQAKYFERTVNRLADVLAQPKNEYIRDSAIHRFEFTFELAWKLFKRYLSVQGLQARSPRVSIRGTFEVGLLPEDEGWLAMIELFNFTSTPMTRTWQNASNASCRVYQPVPGLPGHLQGTGAQTRISRVALGMNGPECLHRYFRQ
jgi:nucleotidyltransferase substrate binding protein (TIGR01987 family)